MSTIARFVLRRRRWVLAFWLLALALGAATAQRTTNRLSYDFSLPGQPGYETSMKILRSYGVSGQEAPYLLVLSTPAGGQVSPAGARAAFDAVGRAVPQARVIGPGQSADPVFRSADGRSEFAYAFLPPASADRTDVAPLQAALSGHAPPGTVARVSGLPVLESGGSSRGPGVLAETMIGGVGALAVLSFVFASVLALLPLLIAAVAITSTFLVLLGLTYLTTVSFVVEFLIALVGLGVAIDYSLLMVTRWREERARGRSNDDAVRVALATAGSAVVFSGLTVTIGLVSMVVLPVPFLRSIGVGGALIPLLSVAVAITLLPAALATVGPRVDWPRLRSHERASGFWRRWAEAVVRRRWLATGAAAAVLVGLMIPLASLRIGQASSDSLAHNGSGYAALQELRADGMPAGALTPAVVLTSADSAATAAARLRAVNGVATAFVPYLAAPAAGAARPAGDPRQALVIAVPTAETSNGPSVSVVTRIRSALTGTPGVVGVSGVGAQQLDFASSVLDKAPYALGLIVLLTYLLLVRAFRSLVLPLKAVLLNLASLAATFGGLVLFWQQGHGSHLLYGIQPTGAITFWLPVMIFAFLFGLSMDYEVFILARIREEFDATGSTDGAIVTALSRTGRLVTSAALILFLAFLSLSSGPQTDLKVFATGLGFGILLDATVVRMLLVPALMSLLGRWNWYLPDPVARLLRVRPALVPQPLPPAEEVRPVPVGLR